MIEPAKPSAHQQAILVVDDDPAVTTSLALLLKQAGYRAHTAADPGQALAALAGGEFALVLQDMNFSRQTSGEEGMALLKSIKGQRPHLPVVLITAWGSVELAVKGIKAGASDFVTKPWTHEQILHAVRTALGVAELSSGAATGGVVSRAELDARFDFTSIVGEDPKILRVLDMVGRVAATDAPVLITGESGTGKELVADALVRNSRRASRPFVKVNLAGVPSSLFESELFGHVKGAFTDANHDRQGRFEAADGGTLFLDEVGDLDPGCQVKLLRALQERSFEKVGSSATMTVDIRVISATNRELSTLIEQGLFREDLLYRLNLIHVHLPPLRDRPGDIPLLAAHLLEGIAATYSRPGLAATDAALRWLSAQPWPGNIRQLKHLLERTALLCQTDQLDAANLHSALSGGDQTQETAPGDDPSLTIDEMERRMIVSSLRRNRGNLTRTAEELGLSRGALYRRIERHGIEL